MTQIERLAAGQEVQYLPSLRQAEEQMRDTIPAYSASKDEKQRASDRTSFALALFPFLDENTDRGRRALRVIGYAVREVQGFNAWRSTRWNDIETTLVNTPDALRCALRMRPLLATVDSPTQDGNTNDYKSIIMDLGTIMYGPHQMSIAEPFFDPSYSGSTTIASSPTEE